MKNIENFLNLISNNKIEIKNMIKPDLLHSVKNKNIFMIDNELWKNSCCTPTLEITNESIQLIMSLDQANFYLNNDICKKVLEFDNIMKKYINLYNNVELQQFKINNMDKFIKIIHNKNLNNYEVYISFNKFRFLPASGSIIKAIRKSMREDGDIMIEPMIEYENDFLIKIFNSTHYLTRYPKINEILIYSTTNKEIQSTFEIVNGFYKTNEMFEAIQSYLDLTENDNCNILDPALINNQEHLDNLVSLYKMLNIE